MSAYVRKLLDLKRKHETQVAEARGFQVQFSKILSQKKTGDLA